MTTLSPHKFSPQEATDRLALQHLVTAYCHGIDRRDYALLRTLYHEGATDEHRPYFEGTAEAYIDWLPSIMETWHATAHAIFNTLFIIDGDTAEGEIATRAWHRTLDCSKDFIAHGRYADQYQKRDGIWRFSHRSLVLDYSEELEVAATDAAATEASEQGGVALGQPDGSDPIYQRLALFHKDRSARS